MKSLKRATILAVAAFIMATLAVSAAYPNAVTKGTAVVDGSAAEWTTSPLNASNPDWFLATCSGGGAGGQANCASPTGDLFLRFDCNTHTLFVLELADRGFAYNASAIDDWIAIGGINNKVVLDSTPYTTNTAPPMWRDLTNGTGYEAAINKDQNGTNLAPGNTYSIIFHAHINGTTSGSGSVDVLLPSCTPTAVTVSSLSADSDNSGMNIAMVALGGAGLVVLGGLVFFAARKRMM
jgi:hypothetical protein